MPQSAWSTRHSPSWASWSLLQESLRKRKTQSIGPSPMSHSPTSFSLHCADFTVHGLSMSSLISLHTWGPSCRFHNQSSWIPWILSWLDLAQDPETTSRNQACLQSGRWRTNRGGYQTAIEWSRDGGENAIAGLFFLQLVQSHKGFEMCWTTTQRTLREGYSPHSPVMWHLVFQLLPCLPTVVLSCSPSKQEHCRIHCYSPEDSSSARLASCCQCLGTGWCPA